MLTTIPDRTIGFVYRVFDLNMRHSNIMQTFNGPESVARSFATRLFRENYHLNVHERVYVVNLTTQEAACYNAWLDTRLELQVDEVHSTRKCA